MDRYKIISPEKAYRGEIGIQRKNFCVDFINQKKATFQRIERDIFAKIEAHGETATCRKGCPVCCVLYIEANIQECEAISYYLHENRQVLNSFMQRYELWRDKMRHLGGPFTLCERVLHQTGDIQISNDDLSAMLLVLTKYQEQNILCSFLDNMACSIHEVRPFVCANHFVSSPADWCRSENWCNPAFPDRPKIYMTTIDEIDDCFFYQDSLAKPVIGFMPTMVYRILTEGLDYIVEATGLESLSSISGSSETIDTPLNTYNAEEKYEI